MKVTERTKDGKITVQPTRLEWAIIIAIGILSSLYIESGTITGSGPAVALASYFILLVFVGAAYYIYVGFYLIWARKAGRIIQEEGERN